jgi:hypothetical protein
MSQCSICKLDYKEIVSDKCVFCNIVENNIKSDVFNIIIANTELKQIDIIKKTYDFFKQNNRIPYPIEIDENVIIIKGNPYVYRKNNKSCKIFFTNCIDYNKIKTPKFPLRFNPQQLNLKYNLVNFNII